MIVQVVRNDIQRTVGVLLFHTALSQWRPKASLIESSSSLSQLASDTIAQTKSAFMIVYLRPSTRLPCSAYSVLVYGALGRVQ